MGAILGLFSFAVQNARAEFGQEDAVNRRMRRQMVRSRMALNAMHRRKQPVDCGTAHEALDAPKLTDEQLQDVLEHDVSRMDKGIACLECQRTAWLVQASTDGVFEYQCAAGHLRIVERGR